MDFVKFLRTPFLTEHLQRLLLFLTKAINHAITGNTLPEKLKRLKVIQL